MPAVGADHEIGIDAFGPAVAQHDHAGCPPACIEQHVSDFATVADLGAGGGRGVYQHTVQHGATRRVECADAELWFDGDRDVVIRITERGGPDRRRARGSDCRQHAPTAQLKDSAAHQRVGGRCVGSLPVAVDNEHAATSPCDEQRGRRARAAGSNDDDIDLHDSAP